MKFQLKQVNATPKQGEWIETELTIKVRVYFNEHQADSDGEGYREITEIRCDDDIQGMCLEIINEELGEVEPYEKDWDDERKYGE